MKNPELCKELRLLIAALLEAMDNRNLSIVLTLRTKINCVLYSLEHGTAHDEL